MRSGQSYARYEAVPGMPPTVVEAALEAEVREMARLGQAQG